MPKEITDKVVGVVVMGDPSHSNTTSFRKGTATTNGVSLVSCLAHAIAVCAFRIRF
jgi:hypothetical protein